jgi:hypothetical protein
LATACGPIRAADLGHLDTGAAPPAEAAVAVPIALRLLAQRGGAVVFVKCCRVPLLAAREIPLELAVIDLLGVCVDAPPLDLLVVIERVEQPDNCVAGELPIPRHMGKRLSAEVCGRGPLSSEAATSGIWWRSQRM